MLRSSYGSRAVDNQKMGSGRESCAAKATFAP
ncbi:hypothetical protein JOD24_003114 [Kroppenstedtia sanguinis]